MSIVHLERYQEGDVSMLIFAFFASGRFFPHMPILGFPDLPSYSPTPAALEPPVGYDLGSSAVYCYPPFLRHVSCRSQARMAGQLVAHWAEVLYPPPEVVLAVFNQGKEMDFALLHLKSLGLPDRWMGAALKMFSRVYRRKERKAATWSLIGGGAVIFGYLSLVSRIYHSFK